jgi:hypothetical protein
MYAAKLVFAQVMEYAPWHTFRGQVPRLLEIRERDAGLIG